MQFLTEIVGLMLIAAATMRTAIGVAAFAGRRFSAARHQQKYIAEFRSVSSRLFEQKKAVSGPVESSWQGTRRFVVVKRQHENSAGTVCSFYLRPHDGLPIPAFRPGQFLTFSLRVPGSEERVMRCYSLSNSPNERGYYRVTVKRIDATPSTPAGSSSNFFHNSLRPGSLLEVQAPNGSFCLEQRSDRPVVLIGGGVGITPLISMLDWIVTTNPRREVWFFYGTRNRREHVMYDHLHNLSVRCPNLHLLVAYSQPTDECRLNFDYQVRGHITAQLIKPILQARSCEIYLCGPNSMIDSVQDGLLDFGVPAEDIRIESFGQPGPGPARRGDAPATKDAGQSFKVTFARSKRQYTWTPDSGSLLDVALDNGVKAKCACRQGLCGTCAVALRQGQVDYAKPPEHKVEAGACLPCVAVPKSDVVIDL